MRLRDPLVVELPWWQARRPSAGEVMVPVNTLRRPFALLAVVIPVVMMVVGATASVVAAHAAERASTEQLGTLGVELGAVLWFGGAVALGLRPRATVLRIVLLVLTAAAGAALIAVAVARDWTGAGLSLAMEYGVGALAIPVVDIVLLGVVHAGIDRIASTRDDRVVHIRLGRARAT